MPTLSIDGGFDVHDYRHGLKLRKQSAETMHLENRAGFTCPACDREFERLFITEKPTTTFNSPPGPFCLARTDEELLVLTH